MFTHADLVTFVNRNVEPRPLNYSFFKRIEAKTDSRGTVPVNGAKVSYTQIRNNRSKQEDVFAIAELQGFDDLPFESQKSALEETFKKLEAKHGQMEKVGSTACAVIVSRDHTVVANIGTSSAFHVRLSMEKELLSERVSTLHTTNEASEKKRIEESGSDAPPHYLTISRSLGGQWNRRYGVIPTPEVKHIAHLPNTHELFIAATDGMTLDEKEVGETVNRTPFTEIDNQLVLDSLTKEGNKVPSYMGNSTVVVIPASPPPEKGYSRSTIVANGIGGREVAQNICNDFFPTLRNEIALAAEKIRQQQAAPAQGIRLTR
jgi:serine/threonine protein phosphatase PrpC